MKVKLFSVPVCGWTQVLLGILLFLSQELLGAEQGLSRPPVRPGCPNALTGILVREAAPPLSKIGVENGLIGFAHETSLGNLIEILKTRELRSVEYAARVYHTAPLSGMTLGLKHDVVFLSPRIKGSFHEMREAATDPVYLSPKTDLIRKRVLIRLPSDVLDHPHFKHACRAHNYGKFDPAYSYLPDQMTEALRQGKFNTGGEFVFRDFLPVNLESLEVWVDAEVRPFLLHKLNSEIGPRTSGKRWEDILRSDSYAVITDPRRISDSEFIGGGTRKIRNTAEALRDLAELNPKRAVKIAKKVLRSKIEELTPVAERVLAEYDLPSFSAHAAEVFRNTGKLDPFIFTVQNLIEAGRIKKGSSAVQEFFKSYMPHSSGAWDLVLDASFKESYFKANWREILAGKQYTNKLFSLEWTPSLKDELVSILPNLDSQKLEIIYDAAAISSKTKNSPFGIWIKGETRQILADRGEQELLRMIELKDKARGP